MEPDPLWERYSRQMLFAPLGRAGQERLRRAHLAVVGCGALGSSQAELLVRAGIGRLTIVDRDYVEASNLQRQRLYDEADARESLPKATAAARHLRAINGEVEVVPHAADLNPENAAELLDGAQILLDGGDNFDLRYLLNDYAVAHGVPWIYGAVVGAYGVTFTILPGRTACLECLFGPQPSGLIETCDTRGVLNWAVQWVAALQVGEAIKLASGTAEALRPTLLARDAWTNQTHELRPPPRDPQCRACGRRDFVYLRGERQPRLTLCGRDAVQIHEHRRAVVFPDLAARLAALGDVRFNDCILKFRPTGDRESALEFTLFPDGRAIVKGTSDLAAARSAYARYLGA